MTIQHRLVIPAGTEHFRIENGKAYDQCPACGQPYMRDARLLTLWRCQCGTQWGGDPCKKCGQGPMAELQRGLQPADRVCLHCGSRETEAKEEKPAVEAQSPVELLKKLGFEDVGELLMLKIFALLKGPGRGPSQSNCAIVANKNGLFPAAIAEQIGNLLANEYRKGFEQGMLHAVGQHVRLPAICDQINFWAKIGTVFTFAGESWRCIAMNGRNREWEAVVGGTKVWTKPGEQSGWDVILKPLFDVETTQGSSPDPFVQDRVEGEEQEAEEAVAEQASPILKLAPDPAAGFDVLHQADEFGIITSLSPDDLVGRMG